ncbi:MAG: FeoB-associated Cys-rich membrane protein [Lachnospiraceae bacterium]|nr:FeoB-associated Cys-rich membrane protein [Lachnospiraceae bacterium]
MMSWIMDNLANIAVIAILAAIIGLAVFTMVRNRKNGKSACGGSCCSCPYGDSCKKPEKTEDVRKS